MTVTLVHPLETDRLYTVSEVAHLLGVSRKTIYDWMTRRGLGYKVLPGGSRRIPARWLTAWVEAQPGTGPP
jgi:excisionase family DNA binding protein